MHSYFHLSVNGCACMLLQIQGPYDTVQSGEEESRCTTRGLYHSPQLQDHFIRYGFMADIHLFQQWVSLTQPNSKTILSGMALWQTFTSFSCGSQLKSKTISLGMAFFTADIHLFRQWVCLSQPKSKTVLSRMALWQTFSCGSLTSRLSSGMTSLQTHTGFSCGSLCVPNFKTLLSGKTLLQTLTGFSCGSLSLCLTSRLFCQVRLYCRHSPQCFSYGSLTLPKFKTVLSGRTTADTHSF